MDHYTVNIGYGYFSMAGGIMKISNRYLTKNNFSRSGRSLHTVIAVVLHWVANPGSTAAANAAYFERLKNQNPMDDVPDRYASAHYIVGTDAEVLCVIPEDEIAYHCGSKTYTDFAKSKFGKFCDKGYSPNLCTIGIEMCHPTESGEFTKQTEESASELCAEICFRYALYPTDDIVRHYDIVGWKDCPRWYVRNPAYFEEFKDSVVARINLKMDAFL